MSLRMLFTHALLFYRPAPDGVTVRDVLSPINVNTWKDIAMWVGGWRKVIILKYYTLQNLICTAYNSYEGKMRLCFLFLLTLKIIAMGKSWRQDWIECLNQENTWQPIIFVNSQSQQSPGETARPLQNMHLKEFLHQGLYFNGIDKSNL